MAATSVHEDVFYWFRRMSRVRGLLRLIPTLIRLVGSRESTRSGKVATEASSPIRNRVKYCRMGHREPLASGAMTCLGVGHFHEMEMFLHVRELRRYTSCFNSPGDTLVSGARRPATVAQQHGSNNSREDLRKTTLDEDMFCNAADDESRRAQRHKCPASQLFFGRGILLSQSLRVVTHDAPT